MHLALERHDIGDHAAAGLQRLPGGFEHARIADAAADEDGIGRGLRPARRRELRRE